MATPGTSSLDSSRESEPVMECRLVLTTLSGTVVEVNASVAKHDRLEDLENHVVDYLAVTDIDVFGCMLDLIHPTMQTYLDDPVWETLQNNTQFTIVLRDCLEALHSKETFDGCPYRDIPQPVKVPMNQAGIIPSGAFVDMSVLKQAYVQLEPKPGRAAAIFGWSECPVLLCELQITPFEVASCSTASQYQAASNLDTRHLRIVAPCSGSTLMGEGLTNLKVQPNLDTTFFETASTWPPLSFWRMAAARSYRPRTRLRNCRQDV